MNMDSREMVRDRVTAGIGEMYYIFYSTASCTCWDAQ